jgi:hypothetical protein
MDELLEMIIKAAIEDAKKNGTPNMNVQHPFMKNAVPGMNPQTVKDNAKLSAKTAKELYDAYVEVGFTQDQAFDLVKGILTTGIRK